MAQKFFVPKFITIEDRLMGFVTFKQLFALLAAFLFSYFIFRINIILGIILGGIAFGLAFVLTFVYINGKPVMYNFNYILEFFLKGRRYIWKRIEKISYKEVEVPKELEISPEKSEILQKFPKEGLVFEIKYKDVPEIKEKIIISQEKPILEQIEEMNKISHQHMINPKNPYRMFPYIKFYKTIKQ